MSSETSSLRFWCFPKLSRKKRQDTLRFVTFFLYLFFQVYPDEGHLLEGVKNHLFHAVTDFLKECFYVPPLVDSDGEPILEDG